MTASAEEPFLGGFVSAVSSESAAVRIEARDMALVAPRVVVGTQSLVSSNGLTVTAWDTTALANGWQEVTEPTGGEKASLLVANLPSIAVEGGRLQSSVTWGADAVHWVRNKVIVPSGVTLTVDAGAAVKFGEHTGMLVEDGGAVRFNGNSSAQVVLTHFADDVYGGDSDFGATNAVWNSWSLTAQSGGTISDLYTQVRYGTVGTLPTLSMPGAVTASRAAGKARVSVSFDTAPTKRAALTWRTVDGTAKYGVDFTQNSGTAVWVSGTTVYFDIPLVNLEDVQEVRTFTIELVTVEGANANPSRLKTTVSITGGDGAAQMPTCAESEESEAIRLETRDPDPKPEPVPASIAIEGGRLLSNATWDASATNFVLNTVVIPSGVTLTVVTNAVVYFTPNTGIKVEPGGKLRVIGSAEQPAVFTAATKGDWSLTVVSGGTFTDSYALFEKTTISQHPTVTVPNGVEVSEKDGEVRVPVAVSGERTSAFRVKWRAIDGTAKFGEDYTLASGEVEWTGTSQGTKYITIPISNDDVEEESETFIVELCDAQGVNIGGAYRCSVLVRDGTAALVPLATCVESEESEAIRLETRDPDPKPEPVPASIAIEGGRLLSNATWDSSATNFVLNTVVVPSGVTLTVVTNAVVFFTPNTGIKVEPGGKLRCVGSQDGPVVFAAANDGDYTINVVSGGTFTDTWTAFRNLNYGGFGTASLDGNLVVDADEGVIRIPVYVTGSRTMTFSVDWEGSDGTTGTIVWNNANEGKKWIELPIEGRAEGFLLWLTEGRGINISGTAHEIAVKVFTSAAPKAVCAESAESEVVRLENRAEDTLARALVYGTEYIAADGETRAVAWDSTTVADGWQANGTLVRNSQSMAIECGRLPSNTTWSNNVTHLVRNWVVVPNGVTLRIEAGTVVKFCELTGFKVEQGGKLIVAGTEESPVVYTAAADDTIGGDSDLREATPNDGDYSVNIVSGGTYTDSNCAIRYTTFSNLGTATTPADVLAALTDGIVRIPVYISTDRTTKFCVDWRTGGSRSCAAASGRLTWNSKNDGTKYIELPLVAGAITNDFDTFTVELYESQGINISTTKRRCTVTIYSNDRFPQGVYAVGTGGSPSSATDEDTSNAIRLEAREPDSDLEIEASETIAIEGGRLLSNTTWSNNVTHLVRQWVVVPSGVTLTIQAGTVVKFLPYTGIKVEPGGRVNANGTAANNIIFTSVSDDTAGGDTDGKEGVPQNGTYSISVISGGTFSTTETQTRYGTSGTYGTLYIVQNAVAKKDDGWVKIPVCISSTSPQAFSVDWYTGGTSSSTGGSPVQGESGGSRSCATASGRLDWPANSTATKYIEIPLDRMAASGAPETFTVELVVTRGINLNQSRKTCLVTLYDTINAFTGTTIGHAESGWCEFAPMDASAGTGPVFAMDEVPIRYSTHWADNGAAMTLTSRTGGSPVQEGAQSTTLYESSSAAEGSTIWNGADYEDGRYDLTHKILDSDGHAVKIDSATFIVNRDVVQHAGRLSTNETWSADKVHLVVATVTVPNGVTLTIAPDAIVKFMPGASIVVEQGGLGICKGAVLTHAYDDVMGGDTFFDGAETVPEDGGYSLSGDWEDDESTQYRYSMPQGVGGTLRGENHWPGHKTYIVTNNLTLASGATLTIDAGAVVKFNSLKMLTVNSGATLMVNGTRSSPVVFTSIKDDDFGGDTNGDGDNSVAQPGDWEEIRNSGGTIKFEYVKCRYAGYGQYTNQGDAILRATGGTTTLYGCTLEQSQFRIIYRSGGTVAAQNCVFEDARTGIDGGASLTNCVVARCNTAVSSATLYNTILWSCDSYGSGTFRNCIAYGTATSVPNGVIFADPKFEDAEKGDYRIRADSPCVDAGDGSVAPVKDYYNQPRQTIQTVTPTGTPDATGAYADIGIYEVQPRYAGADVDLEVKSVMVPETLTVGELVTISWREANIGSVDTDGKWYDKVELISANGAVVTLGTVPVTGIPAGGEKTITEASFRVPAVAEGTCAIRVTANYQRDIYEGSLTANNVCLSETQPTVVVPTKEIGSFTVSVVPGQAMSFKLSDSVLSLFVSDPYGVLNISMRVVDADSGRVRIVTGTAVAGGIVLSLPADVANVQSATVTIENTSGKVESVRCEATETKCAVVEYSPNRIGNKAASIIALGGYGMDYVANVTLSGNGTTVSCAILSRSAGELAVKADGTGCRTGIYALALELTDGSTLPVGNVEIFSNGIGPKLEAELDVPGATRANRIYTGRVIYRNVGDEDMIAPCFRLNARNAQVGLSSSGAFQGNLDFLGIGNSSPHGVLKSGEEGVLEFYFLSGNSPSFELKHLDGKAVSWINNANALAQAATVINSRGRKVVSQSLLQEYVDDATNSTGVAAIFGFVSLIGDTAEKITVEARTRDGAFAASDEVDANGCFILDGLNNSASYYVRAEGTASADTIEVTVPETGDVGPIVIQAIARRKLEVCVTGVPDGLAENGEIILSDELGVELARNSINDGNALIEYVSTNAYDLLFLDCTLDSGRRVLHCGMVSPYDAEFGMLQTVDFSNSTLLTGNVLLEDHTIATGAVVRVRNADYTFVREIRINDDGTYALGALEEGEYAVDATRDGCVSAPSWIAVSGGDATEVNLILPKRETGRLNVTVSGGDAEMTLFLEDISGDSSRAYIVTNGTYAIGSVPRGTYDITLFDGKGNVLGSQDKVIINDEEMATTLSVAQQIQVFGTLKNRAGECLGGVVAFFPTKGKCYRAEAASEDGVFSMSLPLGDYWLACRANGYDAKSCRVELKQNVRLEITLDPEEMSDADDAESDNANGDTGDDFEMLPLVGAFISGEDVSIEFLDINGSTISIVELEPPFGKYEIPTAPAQYSFVWITDGKGSGMLKAKEEFAEDRFLIDMDNVAFATVRVKVYADESKTKPLPGVELVMSGSHSNILSRTTDSHGIATFRLSEGAYEMYAVRILAAEGNMRSFSFVAGESVQIDYILDGVTETDAATWLVKENVGRAAAMRLLGQTRSLSDAWNSALDWTADLSVPRPIKEELNSTSQKISGYSHTVATSFSLEKPTYECEYNRKKWKEYTVAMKKANMALSNASYDLQLLRNAYQRFYWMLWYKAPGYIPGVGWAYALPSTAIDMVNDYIEDKKAEAKYYAELSQEIGSIGDGLKTSDDVGKKIANLEAQVAANESKIAKNQTQIAKNEEKLRAQLQAISENQGYIKTGVFKNGQQLTASEIKSFEKTVKKQTEAYNKLYKETTRLSEETNALRSTVKGLKNRIDDLTKWIKRFNAKAFKATKATKAVKASRFTGIGGKVLSGGGYLVSAWADWEFDLKKHHEDIVRFEGLLASDMADIDAGLNRLSKAFSVKFHTANHDPCKKYMCEPEEEEEMCKINIPTPRSCDPNEMVGPAGVGEERYVKPREVMDYTIYFENQTNATAAAQDVYVTLPKDAGLDWSTFELGEVVFGDNIDTTLSGFYEGESSYALPGTNWSVRTFVEHTADAVKWHLRIVDPTTADNYPSDPYAGFLPPNDPETHCGEGHLRFRVKVKDGAPSGSVINSSASIVFDDNPAIETDPSWWNTVAGLVNVTIGDGEGAIATQLIIGMPYGDALPERPAKDKPGYTFGGWYTGPNGTGRRVTAQSLVEAGDSGLYAHWLTNAYTVRFNANGGEGLMSNQAFKFDTPDELDANAFTFVGHSFAGWATNETGEAVFSDCAVVTNLTDAVDGLVDLYATWTVNSYTVTFDANGGVGGWSSNLVYGASITAPAVTREGHTFAGWQPAPLAAVPASNVTYTAQWTVNQYAVTIDLGGGTGETGATLSYGMHVGDIPLPSKVGYAFGGWWTAAEGGAQIPGDALITGDLSLHARWIANAYTVVFHSGHDGEGFVVSQAFVMDEAKALSSNGFTRMGYTFAGWATNETGEAVYADRAVVSNLTTESGATVDLYATWTVNSYTVTFDANGGEVGWSREMEYGAAIAAPTVTREGYTFAGWQPALLATVPASNVTYTAQWEIIEIVKPDPEPEPEPDVTPDPEPEPKPDVTPEPEPEPQPVVEENPRLWSAAPVGAVPSAAATYEGYLYDANGNVKGTVQVKVGKPNTKTDLAAVKATVIGLDGKKNTLKAAEKGKSQIAADGPTMVSLAGGETCVVTLGAKGMSGSYGSSTIDGSLNVFVSKDAADKAVASSALGKWQGAVNVAWRGAAARPETAPYQTLSVSIAAKGKARVAGTLADGTKVSAKGQLVVGEGWCCVPTVFAKKGAKLAFNVWLPLNGAAAETAAPHTAVVVGLGADVKVGKPGTLKAGATFKVDGEMGDTKYGAYLPDGVAVGGGAKWTLPKAGKVQLAKDGAVDVAKLGENPSALKLTYKAKDGTFKGSFKVYSDANGKPKGATVKVTGVLVNGTGYGTATEKGGGGVPVKIE